MMTVITRGLADSTRQTVVCNLSSIASSMEKDATETASTEMSTTAGCGGTPPKPLALSGNRAQIRSY